jgi:hypothetical protein
MCRDRCDDMRLHSTRVISTDHHDRVRMVEVSTVHSPRGAPKWRANRTTDRHSGTAFTVSSIDRAGRDEANDIGSETVGSTDSWCAPVTRRTSAAGDGGERENLKCVEYETRLEWVIPWTFPLTAEDAQSPATRVRRRCREATRISHAPWNVSWHQLARTKHTSRNSARQD